MKRGMKIGMLALMCLIIAAVLVLVFSADSRNKLKALVSTSAVEKMTATMSTSSVAAAALAGNDACQQCQDACVQKRGLTQNALDVCDIQCSDKCEGGGGGKDKKKPKLKYKLRP